MLLIFLVYILVAELSTRCYVALFLQSNTWWALLVLVRDPNKMCVGLVGKAGRFCTRSKYFHIVYHMNNRFVHIKESLYVLFLLVSYYAFFKPCLSKDEFNNNNLHNLISENHSVGNWKLMFVISIDHITSLGKIGTKKILSTPYIIWENHHLEGGIYRL